MRTVTLTLSRRGTWSDDMATDMPASERRAQAAMRELARMGSLAGSKPFYAGVTVLPN